MNIKLYVNRDTLIEFAAGGVKQIKGSVDSNLYYNTEVWFNSKDFVFMRSKAYGDLIEVFRKI